MFTYAICGTCFAIQQPIKADKAKENNHVNDKNISGFFVSLYSNYMHFSLEASAFVSCKKYCITHSAPNVSL